MQAAATQWHRNQSEQLNNANNTATPQELSGGGDSRSAESQNSTNNGKGVSHLEAEIDSTTDQSLDSSKSDETKQLLASSRPSRLPPPIPPPPGFIEQGLLKDSNMASLVMSPDFNLHSANAH